MQMIVLTRGSIDLYESDIMSGRNRALHTHSKYLFFENEEAVSLWLERVQSETGSR